jgi:hypothetical protein
LRSFAYPTKYPKGLFESDHLLGIFHQAWISKSLIEIREEGK